MASIDNPYASPYSNPYVVAAQPVDARAAFIRKTYGHLAGAILAFALLEALLMSIPGIQDSVFALLGASRFSWLIVLGVFMFVSHIANKWAMSATSTSTQYLGLGVYIVAEALIFLPLLLVAKMMTGDATLIMKAGGVTALLFAGLSVVAFTTKKDFSFLGGMLKIGGMIALGVIVVAVVFPGFITLGFWFSVAMVVFASGCILFNTATSSTITRRPSMSQPRLGCSPVSHCFSGTSCSSSCRGIEVIWAPVNFTQSMERVTVLRPVFARAKVSLVVCLSTFAAIGNGVAELDAVNHAALVLAGIAPAGEEKITKTQAWRTHASAMQKEWSRYEASVLGPMAEWAKTEVAPRCEGQRLVRYLFSGPDVLHVLRLFPDADTYILGGLEPIGVPPDLDQLGGRSASWAFAEVRKSLEEIIRFGFFKTKDMKVDLNHATFPGTLPIMCLFLVACND